MEEAPRTLAQQLDSPLAILVVGTVLGLIAWLLLRVVGAWDRGDEKQDQEITDLRKRLDYVERHLLHVRIHLKMVKPSDVLPIVPPSEESSA